MYLLTHGGPLGLRISPRKPQGFFWLDRVPDRFSFVLPPVGRAARAPVPSFSSYTPFRILSPLLTATKVVVYTGSPGDSRRQTLLFDLFFDTTRNLPPQTDTQTVKDPEGVNYAVTQSLFSRRKRFHLFSSF